jgi:hypothetical protein
MVTLAENVVTRQPVRGADGAGTRPPAGADRPSHVDAVNVGPIERVASVAGGAALAVYGAKRKDLGGALLALLATPAVALTVLLVPVVALAVVGALLAPRAG